MQTLTLVRQDTHKTWRVIRTLIGGYLGLSVLALLAMALLRNHPTLVNTAAWVRGTIVVISAVLMTVLAARASSGHSRPLLRLRLLSAIMVVAIGVIVSVPGTFPAWLKVEQGICGVLLLGVVALANRKGLR